MSQSAIDPSQSAAARDLIASLKRAAGPTLAVAVAARLARGLVGLGIAWVLAGLLAGAVLPGGPSGSVTGPLLALAGLIVVRAGLTYLSEVSAFDAAAAVKTRLLDRLLDHIGRLGPVRISGLAVGDLATTLTDAVAGVEPYWRRWIPAVAAAGTLPFVILAAAGLADWRSGLILTVTLPLLPLFLILVGKGAQAASDRQWQTLARLGGHLYDAIKGLPDLRILGAAAAAVETVARRADDYRRETMAVLRLAFLSALVMEFFATGAIALLAVTIGFRLLWGEMSFLSGLFVLMAAPEFYAPLRAIGSERHARMEALAAAGRIADVLALAAPSERPMHAVPVPSGAVGLRFKGVTMSYGEGRAALAGIDLEVAPGDHVAIVGASGAGKSTLFNLLLGFIEPTDGRIVVGGVPLADLDLASWRRRLIHMPQRAHVFSGTIGDNVAMGRSGDPASQSAAITAALAAAELADLVAGLPDGIATRVGDGGRRLSGGEAQRLVLARALFGAGLPGEPPGLVLFDEPTAHLDSATASIVGEAIAAVGRGRTMLTIAHRLGTIRAADRIVVFDAGRIVEAGTHAELMARAGAYARMLAEARDEGELA
ncbi:MAG: thiol reductant ABC exporter subunit CydD [Ancalomicrobiaceae bacterium]|nr:thiol reductant ABC exporter subunit CydD [Ancalomicrobiaceae bacterium]